MKRTLLATLFGVICVGSSTAQAAISASVGYMRTEMDNSDAAYDYFGERLSTKLNGVNIKASFESDDLRLGVITSLSYSAKTTEHKYRSTSGRRYKEKLEQNYYSILVGPSFQATSWLTPYGLVGAAFNSNQYNYDDRWGYYDDEDDTKSAFAFGGGVQIHPVKLGAGRLLVDFSYERALFKGNTTDSFVAGVGYRF
jgi:attachment invasion locus protein